MTKIIFRPILTGPKHVLESYQTSPHIFRIFKTHPSIYFNYIRLLNKLPKRHKIF